MLSFDKEQRVLNHRYQEAKQSHVVINIPLKPLVDALAVDNKLNQIRQEMDTLPELLVSAASTCQKR